MPPGEGLELPLESVAYLRQHVHRNDAQFDIVVDGTELPALRPVVSPVGAIADVVQNEVNGSLMGARDALALANALERLANDRPLLHRLALAARLRVVNHYSLVRMAEEFDALYARLTP